MGIVPMHQWKVPLKYQATLLFPSGPLGLGGAADTMVGGGVPTKWREQKSTSTYILKLRRNSTGVPYFVTKASSRGHSPPPQPRSLRGFIVILVVVIVIVIITAVTTVLPPLFCDLFDCCVCSVIVSSPLPHPAIAIPPTLSTIVVIVVVVIMAVVAYSPPLRVICLIVVCMSSSLIVSSPRSPPAPPLCIVC